MIGPAEIVDRLDPQLARLARVVSLAARVEPRLLRRLRLVFLPGSDAGLEADLYFSPLTRSHNVTSMVLQTEFVELLREQLSGPANREQLDRAAAVIEAEHRSAPSVIRLEEKVTWLALQGETAAEQLEAELMQAVRTLTEEDRPGMAQWVARALPRLPPRARQTKAAWLLALGAAARLGGREILGEGEAVEVAPELLRAVLPRETQTAQIGVRLLADGIEFGDLRLPGAKLLSVPNTSPVTVDLLWSLENALQEKLPAHVVFSLGSRKKITPPVVTDGQRVVTASGDGTARLWDAATGKPIGEPMIHEAEVNSAQFSPDGQRLLTASSDKTARLWDAISGKPIGEPMKHHALVDSGHFSLDGQRVVTASHDGTARLWDAAKGRPIGKVMKHESWVVSAEFSPDGQRVVTASDDKTACLWDGASGKPIGEPMKHESPVNSAHFSPDGQRVVTASWDNTARLWDATSGKPIGEPMKHESGDPMKHESSVNSAHFSPDGQRVVTASLDKTARLWDAANGKPIGEPMKHNEGVSSAQFSPDGQCVVTASYDRTARVWDAATGKPIGEPMIHEAEVISAQFSPDGRRVVTASRDTTARLWDALSGTPIGAPMKHGNKVYSAQFSPEASYAIQEIQISTSLGERHTLRPMPPPSSDGRGSYSNRIFLSHSSVDEREAVALNKWLADNGWDDVFLDLDPQRGLAAGERWQEALRQAADRCEAVIFIVSPTWAKSKWSFAEFLLAKSLHKQIFGVVLKDVPIGELPTEMTSEWQLYRLIGTGPTEIIQFRHRDTDDSIAFLAEGLGRLKAGLKKTGLSADFFPWPPKDEPHRSPFRGLEPLDFKDAAVFFGRDLEILRGLDALRGLRDNPATRLFVILAAAGTGKSSFLRAGLLPRLARDDRHFLPLTVVRPETAPISGDRGLAEALARAMKQLGLSGNNPGDLKERLSAGAGEFASILSSIQAAARVRFVSGDEQSSSPAPTLVLPVDQTEELFNADAGPEARKFLSLISEILRDALTPVGTPSPAVSLIVVFTIRSDRYELLQSAPELAGLQTTVFDDLKPMSATRFREVITGPAQRASTAAGPLEIKPDLVERLVQDCATGADTLPLLSLTLERLYHDFGSDGDLRLDEYIALGGMGNIINDQIEKVLDRDPTKRKQQLALLRTAFIPWLVTINPQNDEPMRRLARRSDLPLDSLPLVDALVENRLLIRAQRHDETVIEVAHEILIRQWDVLAGWLQEERGALREADALERASREWEESGRDESWLWGGQRLQGALALAGRAGFRTRLQGCSEFLERSRNQQEERDAELRIQTEKLKAAEELAAAQAAARQQAEKGSRSFFGFLRRPSRRR